MRTRQEIDQEYTNTAAVYGDLQFKLTKVGETREQIAEELKRLFIKLSELIQEPATPLVETPVVEKGELPVMDAHTPLKHYDEIPEVAVAPIIESYPIPVEISDEETKLK